MTTDTINIRRETIERLMQLWDKYPQLRLAQLIWNCQDVHENLYYLTDEQLLTSLETFYEKLESNNE